MSFTADIVSSRFFTSGIGKNRRPESIISPRHLYAGASRTSIVLCGRRPPPAAMSCVRPSSAYVAPKTLHEAITAAGLGSTESE